MSGRRDSTKRRSTGRRTRARTSFNMPAATSPSCTRFLNDRFELRHGHDDRRPQRAASCIPCSSRPPPAGKNAPRTNRRSATTTPPAWIRTRSIARGLKPLQPEFDRIAALKSKDDLTDAAGALSADQRQRLFQLWRAAGLQGRAQADRRRRSGRPGIAGARLLLPHRRRGREDPQAICAARHQHAQADGRARSARPPATRKKIMQLETALAKVSHGYHFAARSRKCLSPDAGRRSSRS